MFLTNFQCFFALTINLWFKLEILSPCNSTHVEIEPEIQFQIWIFKHINYDYGFCSDVDPILTHSDQN